MMRKLSYSSRKIAIAVTLAVAAVALTIIYGAQARPSTARAASGRAGVDRDPRHPARVVGVRDHRRTMGHQGARAGRQHRRGCADQRRAARESCGSAADLPWRADHRPAVRSRPAAGPSIRARRDCPDHRAVRQRDPAPGRHAPARKPCRRRRLDQAAGVGADARRGRRPAQPARREGATGGDVGRIVEPAERPFGRASS